MVPIPLIREQMYQVSPVSFFHVAGILPDGNVSGRFFKSDPDSNGKEVTRLVVDEAVPSDGRDVLRGSGFTTSLPVSHFLTGEQKSDHEQRVVFLEGPCLPALLACGPSAGPPRQPPHSNLARQALGRCLLPRGEQCSSDPHVVQRRAGPLYGSSQLGFSGGSPAC
jgi:hypothetical protein